MFISQVIFESEIVNKEIIKKLMEKKSGNVKLAAGILSSECWWKENSNTVGFSLIMKWSDKESFISWMRETHKGGHKNPELESINIKKTSYQFEPVD